MKEKKRHPEHEGKKEEKKHEQGQIEKEERQTRREDQ